MLLRFLRKFHLLRPAFHASALQTLDHSGPEIERFQELLNKRGRRYGVRVAVTGRYDEQTKTAMRAFQKQSLNIINSDGFVGPLTAWRLHIRLIDDTLDQRDRI